MKYLFLLFSLVTTYTIIEIESKLLKNYYIIWFFFFKKKKTKKLKLEKKKEN